MDIILAHHPLVLLAKLLLLYTKLQVQIFKSKV